MAGGCEGVDREFRGRSPLVLRIRTLTTVEIHLQPLAPLHFVASGHFVRNSPERQFHPTVYLLTDVRIRREMFAGDVHHAVPPVVGGGHKGDIDRYSLDEVENTEYDHHDDDLRVVIKPGCGSHDGVDQLDMWVGEEFRFDFLADPQCQRERQRWSEWERRTFKHIDTLRKEHLRCPFSVRIPTADPGKQSWRAKRRGR